MTARDDFWTAFKARREAYQRNDFEIRLLVKTDFNKEELEDCIYRALQDTSFAVISRLTIYAIKKDAQ